MALSTATITFDIADMLGVDFDARRTKVWVTTNVPDETVVDTVGNKIRLGSGNVTINTDGTGSAIVWVPGTGSNPSTWQTYFHVDYPDRNSSKGRATRDFGPFTITTAADLADLILEQEVPPTYLSTVTALLDTKVAEAQAARDGAVAIVGPVDGVVEALVKNTGGVGPLTSAALSATLVPQSHTGVDVVANGVDNTGATNTASALHALRDAAAAFGTGLRFPKGTYLVSELVANKPGQTWNFEPGAKLKMLAGGSGSGIVISAADVTINYGEIDGNGANVTGGAGVYCLVTGVRATIRGTVIRDTWGRGIDSNATGFKALGVKVYNSGGDGIIVFPDNNAQGNLEDVEVTDCLVDRSTQTVINGTRGPKCLGIFVGGGRATYPAVNLIRPNVSRNTVIQPPDAVANAALGVCITVGWPLKYAVVNDNRTVGGGIGVSVEPGSYTTVSGNVVAGVGCGPGLTPSFGIEVAGGAFSTVSNNVVDGQGLTDRGIAVSDSPTGPVTFGNNVVTNCGVCYEHPASGYGGSITGNVADGFTAAGIRINGLGSTSSTRTTIVAGNNVSAGSSVVSGARGVEILDARHVSVIGNGIRNAGTGVLLSALTSGYVTDKIVITSNQIVGCTTPLSQVIAAGTFGLSIFVRNNVGVVDANPTAGDRFITGRWYGPQFGAASSAAVVANTLHAFPFAVAKVGGMTIDRADIEVTTAAAGSTLRVGIYADSDGTPGALVQEFTSGGALDSSTTGVKSVTGLSRNLQPGLYWVVVVAQGGTPTLGIVTGTSPYVGRLSAGTGGHTTGYSLAGVTGALPATFGTPSGNNYAINLALRAA